MEETTITSCLPDRREEVVLNLNFSISSFIARSFSMYVFEDGINASGW